MSPAFAKTVVEEAALAWLAALGYAVLHGPDIAADAPGAECSDPHYHDVRLERRLRQALVRLNPDISILSDEFLADVRGMPQRNLAVELLQQLLKGEIKARAKRNVVQARSFADLLEQAVRKYQNRAIETAQVIEELIQLAKDMRAAGASTENRRGRTKFSYWARSSGLLRGEKRDGGIVPRTVMSIKIRSDLSSGVAAIHALTVAAFLDAPYGSHTEQFITNRRNRMEAAAGVCWCWADAT